MLDLETQLTHYFTTLNAMLPETQVMSEILSADLINTPLGVMLAVCSAQGLCLLEFIERASLKKELYDVVMQKRLPIQWNNHSILLFAAVQLRAYFSGYLNKFSIKLDWIGTPFQQHAWQILCMIPYGKTISYKEQAYQMGHLKAVRAVASANRQNKISIIVPCHRVIGSDGKLTGYAGGLWRKKALLTLEAQLKQN